MKAISLWQPWASAVAVGSKRFETRSWQFPESLAGQIVAIHAAKRWRSAEESFAFELHRQRIDIGFKPFSRPPLGAIVAVARLADCIPTRSMFGSDPDNPRIAIDKLSPCAVLESITGTDGRPLWTECGDKAVRVLNTRTEYLLGDYRPGRFAWRLLDVRALDRPIPYKGAQRFFDVPDQLIANLTAKGDLDIA